MNIKTTLMLFLLVVGLGATIVFLKEKAPPPAPTSPDTFSPIAQQADKKLFEEKDGDGAFGDVTEIIVAREGQVPWHFVKRSKGEGEGEDTNTHWEITEPVSGKAQKWQVEQIANRLSNATYTAKYEDGKNTDVTPASTGLAPPRAIVTLIDTNSSKRVVQLGRNEGENESYVRVEESGAGAGAGTIYRVKPSLKTLLKKKPLEYLDQQLFNLSANDVVQLSITTPAPASANADQGTPEIYTLVKTGTEWRFQTPAPAKAMSPTVQTLCNTFAGLRTMTWVDDNVSDPNLFGLGEAALTVTVTTQEEPPPHQPAPASANAPANDADAQTNGANTKSTTVPPAAPTTPVTKTYTVVFSKVSPIGDDNKVYVRRGNEKLVGTMMKSVADKFLPNLKTWRDSRLLQRDPALTRKLTLTIDGKKTTFLRGGTKWSYQAGGLPADADEIQKMLNALKGARALNFVAGAKEDPAKFGLDTPRVVLTLTFDGGAPPTRIAVGGFADPNTKRIAYIQTDGGDSVAKVRVSDANALVRQSADFRDRTVLAVRADSLRELAIKRTAGDSPTKPAVAFTLANTNGVWSMSQPVKGAVDKAKTNALVRLLGYLRATKIIDLDANADLAAYGLDAPPVSLSYTYLPPKVYKVQTGDTGTNGANGEGASKVTPYQPLAETRTLRVAQHAGKTYLKMDDQQDVVYEIEPAMLTALTTEYRSADLFNFAPSQVSRVSLTTNGFTQGFRKTDAGWQYEPEADLPVDAKKITNYLLRITDLKVVRVVDYDANNLADYGLDAPAYALTVEVGGTALPELHISAKATKGGQPYAMATGANVVFVLPKDAVERIAIDVAEFESP